MAFFVVFWMTFAGARAEGTQSNEQPAAVTRPDADDVEFFEKNIRPLLVDKCYSCHSAQAKKVKGNLLLDSRQAIAKGGENGPIIDGRDPAKSHLIQAIRWTDPELQMPPKEKLTSQQIESLEQWVRRGVPDPREAAASQSVAPKLTTLEQGRKWWAFQPVAEIKPPANDPDRWAKNKLDYFVLAKLRAAGLTPSAASTPAELIRRAYLDLTGIRPTFEQVQAFSADKTPGAYEALIDRLLASPQYGERWGRYWLDVVRYGEDNFTGEATTPPFPFAWRYRDWVIEALNNDIPYDRFVKLQLAADLMPGTDRHDLIALGFLGSAPNYHKDGRLSKDVVETLYTDDWDERLDTVTRGFLGLTVACARCHDHKFDPIPTADYYSLASVFASTVQSPRPLSSIDAASETKFMLSTQQIFYRSYVVNLLREDPGTKVKEAREKVYKYTAEMEHIRDENAGLRAKHPELYNYLSQLAKRPSPYPDDPAATQPAQPINRNRGRRGASTEPLFQAVYDAGFWLNGSDPDLTMLDARPGVPRDLNVLAGGNVTRPGATAPRGFLTVLSKGDSRFHEGSGRRELADKIFSDAAALSARVIVNRVWAWHFGKPLVATPSDFGVQGERPTHPELLDDLAARFIAHGYSLKWLHREIMMSATYRQSSHPRDDAMHVDPTDSLLWRMNPRRLDVEAFRDCLLFATGMLDDQIGGVSTDLDRPGNRRRTVYGRIGRERVSTILKLYDFPEPTMHSPQRETTTTPLQQLFVLNGSFVQDCALALANTVSSETDSGRKVSGMYRRLLGREPSKAELELGQKYLETSSPTVYAQALLATNEVIFWP